MSALHWGGMRRSRYQVKTMGRYYFDYLNCGRDQIDVRGVEYDNDAVAQMAARAMLAERAPHEIIQGGDPVATVRVRRGSVPIFSITFSVTEAISRLDG